MDAGILIADKRLVGTVLSGSIDDYPEGIVFPIDKPYRWTSADVVRKLKWAACKHFGKKNLKVGHAGTLDPLATGVLLVCVGKACRQAEAFQKEGKEYVAGISFGATTPSYDLEKAVDKLYPTDNVSEKSVLEVLPKFVGEQDQVAPLFSAKSVDGVRAYELARRQFREKGLSKTDVIDDFDHTAAEALNIQRINIHELELLDFAGGHTDPARVHSRFAAAEYGQGRMSPQQQNQPQPNSRFAAAEYGQGRMSPHGQRHGGPDSRINVTDTSGLNLPLATVRIACSKGTYIRALARDLGEALGSGAHLNSLRRTKSGGFEVESALSISEALELLKPTSNQPYSAGQGN